MHGDQRVSGIVMHDLLTACVRLEPLGDACHPMQDVRQPERAALWSKTKEPKFAPLPKKAYSENLMCADPYDVYNKVCGELAMIVFSP